MLLKTIIRAPQSRLSALVVLTLAAFIPPAIPATASASTEPHSFLYGQYNGPPGTTVPVCYTKASPLAGVNVAAALG